MIFTVQNHLSFFTCARSGNWSSLLLFLFRLRVLGQSQRCLLLFCFLLNFVNLSVDCRLWAEFFVLDRSPFFHSEHGDGGGGV